MTIQTLESFDIETARKRAQLQKDLELVAILPTHGKVVTWEGEGGWLDDNTKAPVVVKTCQVIPFVVHTPFRTVQSVTFRIPDDREGGEAKSSKYRSNFERAYIKTLLDVSADSMVDTLAIRNTHYASYVADGWDYLQCRDYEGAHETARGKYMVNVSTGEVHENMLEWFVRTPQRVVQFGIELPFSGHRLAARGRYETENSRRPNAWSFPTCSETGAVECFRRAHDGASRATGYTLEWLFDDRRLMEIATGIIE